MAIAEGRMEPRDRSGSAAAMMFAGSLLLSLFPVAAVYWGGAPLMFAGCLCAMTSIGMCAYIAIFYRRLFFDRRLWRIVRGRILSWHIAVWTVGCMDGAFFVAAVGFINAAVADALYQLSPLLIVLFVERLFAGRGRYDRFGWFKASCFALAAAGAGMVIAAEAGGFGELTSARASWGALAIGAGLALCAAAVDGLSGAGFRWGVDLAAEISERGGVYGNSEIFCILLGSVCCNAFVSVILISASVLTGEAFDGSTILWGFGGGLGFGVVYTILWRSANLLTSNLGVNVIRYFSVAFAVLWLWMLGRMGEAHLGLLISGVAIIIIANIGVYMGRIRLFGLRRPLRRARRIEEAAR